MASATVLAPQVAPEGVAVAAPLPDVLPPWPYRNTHPHG